MAFGVVGGEAGEGESQINLEVMATKYQRQTKYHSVGGYT